MTINRIGRGSPKSTGHQKKHVHSDVKATPTPSQPSKSETGRRALEMLLRQTEIFQQKCHSQTKHSSQLVADYLCALDQIREQIR